jgi:iron complex outermembrane receptor protein
VPVSAIRRALAALILLSSAVIAQTDTLRADSTPRLKTVTVSGSRSAGTVGGASAVVINPVELRSSPAPVLDQALRESPFVHVRLNSRGEMELSVRGSDSRQAAVLIDGVPVTLGWDHRTDPSIIPVTGAERMVIVRGLGSLLNGPNTLGGTVEVTHDASAFRSGGRAMVGAGIDEFGSLVGTLGGGRTWESGGGFLSLRAGLAHRQRDGLALPDDADDPTARDGLRTNSDLRETDGFASVRWNNMSGRSIGFTLSAMNAEKGVPPEEHIGGPRLWRYPYHRRAIAALSASTGVFTTPLGIGSLDVGFGRNAGKVKIETFDDRDYSTVTGEELGDEDATTLRAVLTHSFGSVRVRAGITNADIHYTETLSPAAPAEYRQVLQSTGAEVELPLGSGATRLAGGVVFDKSKTPETGGRTPSQEPFDNMGWRLGVTHDLNATWALHASVSERSRFPALRELYSGALNRFRPNPDLKPETLLGIEGGVTMSRAFGTNHATFQVTGFNHTLDDAVVRITLSNPTRFMRVNRDRIESTGAEFLAGLTFGADPERAVTVNADAMLQSIKLFDVTAGDAQRHAENNPEQRGRVELGIPLPWQIRGFASARHTGRQYCLNADTQSEMTLNAATTMDLAVQKTISVVSGPFRWLRTVLSFDNVGNVAVFDQCGLPQPGRTLRLMMTLR